MNESSRESSDSQEMFNGVARGDDAAAEAVFEAYCGRLVHLARQRISTGLNRRVDAEDVVQSVFRSFFQRAQQGQYQIGRGGDLWRLLVSITRNKVLKKAEHHTQKRRSIKREQAFDSAIDIGQLAAHQPDDQEAVALTDELEAVMKQLDAARRQVMELRLQGLTVPEIANEIDRTERTVRRYLGDLREVLEVRLAGDRDGIDQAREPSV